MILYGPLTRDPLLKYVGGTAICEIGMGIIDPDGQFGEEKLFVNIMLRGNVAEEAAEHWVKGSPAFVEGRLRVEQWGQHMSRLRVEGDRIEILGPQWRKQ